MLAPAPNTLKQAGRRRGEPGPELPRICERTFTANNTPMSCAACGATAHGFVLGGLKSQKRERMAVHLPGM